MPSSWAENYKTKFGVYPPKHGKTYIYYEIDRPLMDRSREWQVPER